MNELPKDIDLIKLESLSTEQVKEIINDLSISDLEDLMELFNESGENND